MAFSRQVIFPDFNRKGDRRSPEGLSVTQGALDHGVSLMFCNFHARSSLVVQGAAEMMWSSAKQVNFRE